MQTFPVFVINLPKDTDRRAFMEKQLIAYGIHYEIIEARYGKDEDVLAACDDNLAIKEHGKVLSLGEKGCAFSHRSTYEKMLANNIDVAVILEDDVVLPENFVEIVSKQLTLQDKNFEWLSFDYPKIGFPFIYAWLIASKKMIAKNKLFFLYAVLKFPLIVCLSLFEAMRDKIATVFPSCAGPKIFYRPLYNAGAYIITKKGIEKLSPLLYPLRFSADRTPNQARLKTGLCMRWYVPRVVHQTDEDEGNTFMSNTI